MVRPPTLVRALLTVVMAAACTDSTAPPVATGLLIVAGPALQDTVDAVPSQPLVVEVRDTSGTIAQGIQVFFTAISVECGSLDSCPVASILVKTGQQSLPSGAISAVTDADGQIRLFVSFGFVAGPGGLVVSAPDLGLADTIQFTILPGAAVALYALPADTTLTAGGVTFAPMVRTIDRHANERQDPVTWSTNSAQLTVTTTGLRTGDVPARVRAIAENGALRDTVMVSVVPPGVIVANRFAFGRESLVIIGTDGSSIQELITDDAEFGHGAPEWSANGASVFYRGGTAAETQLLSISLTGDVEPLTTTGVLESGWPSASSDGAWIYFSGRESVVHHLWRIRTDGTQLERVSDSTTLISEVRPSVSPDGGTLAYESSSTITLRNLTTGDVTATPHSGSYARFSPTGDRIAYLRPGALEIAVMDVDGSNERLLTVATGFYRGLDWSTDGDWIVTSRESELLLIEVATGNELPLRWQGQFSQPAWRP